MPVRIGRFAWSAAGLLLAAASCGVDDRSLSYQLSLGSAANEAGAAMAGESAGKSGASGSTEGGRPATSATGGAGGDPENAGGSSTPSSGGDSPVDGGAPSMAGTNQGGVGGGGDVTSGGSAPGGGSSGSAGTSGSGGSGGSDIEPGNFPCGNLNRNAVDDCSETLVTNSRFDAAATGWQTEGALAETWNASNARGGSASGSLSLVNSNVVAGATGNTALSAHQCIVAWGNEQFELGARVRISASQGGGSAGLNLSFYANDGCDGTWLGGEDVALTSEAERWVVVRNKLTIPAGTRSARVRLMVAKPFEQLSLQAFFDDVLVVKL